MRLKNFYSIALTLAILVTHYFGMELSKALTNPRDAYIFSGVVYYYSIIGFIFSIILGVINNFSLFGWCQSIIAFFSLIAIWLLNA